MQKIWSGVVIGGCKGTPSSTRRCAHFVKTGEADLPAVEIRLRHIPSLGFRVRWHLGVPGIWAHGWQVPWITLSSAVDITITQTRRRACDAWSRPRFGILYSMKCPPRETCCRNWGTDMAWDRGCHPAAAPVWWPPSTFRVPWLLTSSALAVVDLNCAANPWMSQVRSSRLTAQWQSSRPPAFQDWPSNWYTEILLFDPEVHLRLPPWNSQPNSAQG